MKTDLLACRHIGINETDEEKMLRKIGVDSLDELINKTIPADIRLKSLLSCLKPSPNMNTKSILVNWQLKTSYIVHI